MKDLDQKIPRFPNCDNYGICRASNPNPLNDDTKTNDNELHQQLCVTFKIDYLQEMDIITKVKARLVHTKSMSLYWHFYLRKLYRIPEGQQHLVTKQNVTNTALRVKELYHY